MLCRIQSISKFAAKYSRSSLYLLAALVVLWLAYIGIDFTNRSLLTFCLAVPLGMSLVFIALFGREGDGGMGLGEFESKEMLGDEAEAYLAEEDPFADARSQRVRRMGTARVINR